MSSHNPLSLGVNRTTDARHVQRDGPVARQWIRALPHPRLSRMEMLVRSRSVQCFSIRSQSIVLSPNSASMC